MVAKWAIQGGGWASAKYLERAAECTLLAGFLIRCIWLRIKLVSQVYFIQRRGQVTELDAARVAVEPVAAVAE